jgi:hypothetical protein
MNPFAKYTKRYFILDIETASFSYSSEQGKKPKCTVMVRVILIKSWPSSLGYYISWEYEQS